MTMMLRELNVMLCLSGSAPIPPAAGSVAAEMVRRDGMFFSILFTHDARSWGSSEMSVQI